jgi:anti-anti-sigma factor
MKKQNKKRLTVNELGGQMFDCKVEESDDKKTLTINGELKIQDAAELQKVLIESLENTEHLDLNIENISGIDLSCLQMLCSAHRTTLSSNKRFTLSTGCSEIIREAVNVSGYQQFEGCELGRDSGCKWIECSNK